MSNPPEDVWTHNKVKEYHAGLDPLISQQDRVPVVLPSPEVMAEAFDCQVEPHGPEYDNLVQPGSGARAYTYGPAVTKAFEPGLVGVVDVLT